MEFKPNEDVTGMFKRCSVEEARASYLALISTLTPEQAEVQKAKFKEAYGEDL